MVCSRNRDVADDFILEVRMRNYELIKAIYNRCPDGRDHPYTVDQYFDRCQDIIDMIEIERPELKNEPATGCDYVRVPSFRCP